MTPAGPAKLVAADANKVKFGDLTREAAEEAMEAVNANDASDAARRTVDAQHATHLHGDAAERPRRWSSSSRPAATPSATATAESGSRRP